MAAMITISWRRSDPSLKQLRRECQKRLDALHLPAPFEISTLCEHLSRERARPIHLIPMAMQAVHPCGVWVASDTADFIFFDTNTSKPHQEHIVMHELAHIMCRHCGIPGLDDDISRLLFPDLNPELVRDMLRRTMYSSAQEQEAEIMASLILGHCYPKVTEFDGEGILPVSTGTLARVKNSLMPRDANA